VTIYAGAAATGDSYLTAVQTPGANVIFAGHTVEYAAQPSGQITAGSVQLKDANGGDMAVGIAAQSGEKAAPVSGVNASTVAAFGCNSSDLANQYGGTTFTGTKPTTNTTAENAGAAAYTDTMVRGGTVTKAGDAARAAMVKTTNQQNRLPENKDHPYSKPQVCTTTNGQQTCR
jgi:hypothetical protein